MKPATTHPTPPPVVDAVQVIAAWLRVIEAVEAIVSPTGGAAFHTAGRERTDARARRVIERARLWAPHDEVLRDLIREWEASQWAKQP